MIKFFHAKWCSNCNFMINNILNNYKGDIEYIDVEERQDEVEKYDIQTLLVI